MCDDITSELIQNADITIQDELFKLVSDVYITREIPEDLKKFIIITFPQKKAAEKYNDSELCA